MERREPFCPVLTKSSFQAVFLTTIRRTMPSANSYPWASLMCFEREPGTYQREPVNREPRGQQDSPGNASTTRAPLAAAQPGPAGPPGTSRVTLDNPEQIARASQPGANGPRTAGRSTANTASPGTASGPRTTGTATANRVSESHPGNAVHYNRPAQPWTIRTMGFPRVRPALLALTWPAFCSKQFGSILSRHGQPGREETGRGALAPWRSMLPFGRTEARPCLPCRLPS